MSVFLVNCPIYFEGVFIDVGHRNNSVKRRACCSSKRHINLDGDQNADDIDKTIGYHRLVDRD